MTPGSFKGRFAASLVTLCSILAACSGSDAGTGPKTIAPASVAAASTVPVSAQVGTTLTPSPIVVVKGAKNQLVAGVAVTFAVTGGGSIVNTAATTDANGQASPGAWVLGTQTGTNTVVATVAGLSPITFQVTATAGDPATITPLSDNTATAVVGQVISPGVRVADRFGNPVANTTVTFTAITGTLNGSTATTDNVGVAHVAGWTLASTAGPQTLNATAGIAASPIAVTTTAAAPTQIIKITGDAQSGVVGTVITTLPSVKVTDSFGNIVAGTTVTYTVTEGNSVLVGASQNTSASGIATLGGWTLGTAAGRNTVTATLTSGASAQFTANGAAAPFTGLTITAGNAQTATVNTSVGARPTVRARDDFGNGIPGVNVTFAISSGGGSITGATVTTGADGIASLGTWVLGTAAGQNTVTASANGVPSATFTATAVAGAATQLVKAAGDAQSVQAGTAVPVQPTVSVQDKFGNRVSGANVTFTVTSGGGVITGAGTQQSNASGLASAPQWTLGNPGANTLNASIGVAAVTFTATATGTLGFTISKVSGDNTACTAGFGGCNFVVKVTNSLNAPAAGQTVVWTSGTQSLSTTTDGSGLASAANIVAQNGAGSFTQTATLSSTNTAVTFNYLTAAAAPGNFNIDLRFIGSVTASQLATFSAAVAKWQSVITGDLPGFNLQPGEIPAGDCGVAHPALVGNIDDLVIYVELKFLDGFGTPAAGNLLGQAYPCFIRNSDGLPVVGVMQFDTTDLTTLANNGTLQAVITHEMGHVLGVGSLWDAAGGGFDLVSGAGGTDPFLKGVASKDYYGRIGGTIAVGNGVPVENCVGPTIPSGCGAGTRDVHWRESVFQNELMTGYVSRISNPLSTVTIASLQDEGYQVNFGAADAFTLATAVSGNRATTPEGSPEMINAEGVWLKEGHRPAPRRLGH